MNKAATEVSENSHHLKVFLPKKLVDSVPRCPALPQERLRWNTNEEIASYLITFERHDEWLSCSPKTRPRNGSLILYNRKKVKYRKDGYCWKKRKDGKTTREDHMKLKVKGVECLYGCYVHSSIIPTFHRRCYWLLQNPDIVLVHYLNVPAIEDCGKLCSPVFCSLGGDRKEWVKWTTEELVGQLRPMFHGIEWTCSSSGSSTSHFSVEQLVQQILGSHQAPPPPRTHACLCGSRRRLGNPGNIHHKCSSTKHRIISPKVEVRPCPALTEVQNICGSPEARTETEPAKAAHLDGRDPPPAKACSPSAANAVSSPGPAQPGGFSEQELPRAVLPGLPARTVFLMAEAPLALTPSQQLVSGEGGAASPTPLGLALLPGPGLVLSQNLDATMETSEGGPAPFDPDRFLNSPRQGQTYGGSAGLHAKAGPPEKAGAPAFPLCVPTNRFFIQDDGAGRPPAPPSAAQRSRDMLMETAGERANRSKGAPGEEGGQDGGGLEPPPKEQQEELSRAVQKTPVASGPFGLTLDHPFPSLLGQLMAEGGGTGGPLEVEGPSLPEPPAEPRGTGEGGPEGLPWPLAPISDFSPEWSFPEGGVKVLITGPWADISEPYSCLFGQVSVPASLIQSGVLRCYCPAHEAGLVPLQVARTSRPVSLPALFEYRPRSFLALPSAQLDWLSLDDNQFRMSILERLEQMEKRMAALAAAAGPGPAQPPGDKAPGQAASDSFEDRIVALCEKMMLSQSWLQVETLMHHVSFRGMTLLHLAAAQGYTRLIETLIRWRNLSAQNLDLEQEADPLNVDHFSCTPLMWACALGHLEAAQMLFCWNSHALSIPDSLGRLPLAVARSRGHVKLATRLEELQQQQQQQQQQEESLAAEGLEGPSKAGSSLHRPTEALRTPSPLSASPDTGLSTASGVSSPSERSEGSVASNTSAYSSGSALRESPAYSPEGEGPMDVCQGPRPESVDSWYLREAPSPSGQPHPPFLRGYSDVEVVGPPGSPEAELEPELLAYGENAENEEQLSTADILPVDVITLAKQIIEATPDRIKQEDFVSIEAPLRERSGNVGLNETMSWLASYLESMDQPPGLSQRRAVASSPPGRACLGPLPSPLAELALERLPRPPTAASWAEFLNASGSSRTDSDFAPLTLSDQEQRELYEAAKIIQAALRKYKGRRLKEQQEMAAAVIQRCYHKYKQLTWIALKYALYQKMTQAAILIQSKFRSYYEQKKFRQSRRAAVLIQQYYRSYKEYERLKQGRCASAARQQKIQGAFLTKKQDQAARKIMRFLRRCRHRMKELKQRQEMEAPPANCGVAT